MPSGFVLEYMECSLQGNLVKEEYLLKLDRNDRELSLFNKNWVFHPGGQPLILRNERKCFVSNKVSDLSFNYAVSIENDSNFGDLYMLAKEPSVKVKGGYIKVRFRMACGFVVIQNLEDLKDIKRARISTFFGGQINDEHFRLFRGKLVDVRYEFKTKIEPNENSEMAKSRARNHLEKILTLQCNNTNVLGRVVNLPYDLGIFVIPEGKRLALCVNALASFEYPFYHFPYLDEDGSRSCTYYLEELALLGIAFFMHLAQKKGIKEYEFKALRFKYFINEINSKIGDKDVVQSVEYSRDGFTIYFYELKDGIKKIINFSFNKSDFKRVFLQMYKIKKEGILPKRDGENFVEESLILPSFKLKVRRDLREEFCIFLGHNLKDF